MHGMYVATRRKFTQFQKQKHMDKTSVNILIMYLRDMQ